MTVNFNNLRKQACFTYDKLCAILNKSMDYDGTITVSTLDIQEHMDDLKMMLGSIASCYQKDDDDVRDVYSEAYPGEKTMVSFNPEGEDAP